MTSAAVKLWGTRIGAVSWDAEQSLGFFEYDPAFLASNIEVAPLSMPLAESIYSFPALPKETYFGLAGMLADVLPDRFGNALIDAWLASRGRTPESFNPVERLCYTGTRGMGALEFEPAMGAHSQTSEPLDIAALVELAGDVLAGRESFKARLEGEESAAAVRDILRVGTSAGGARAKAVVAWNPETGELRSGQVDVAQGFSHWLLKFDGIAANRDKELADPTGYGRIEYAYHRMALAAGIEMTECRLLHENGRAHFMTRRFDRTETGAKLHMQSLCAIAHLDFNLAGAHSYEQALFTMRRLGLPMADLEQQFRRAAFNVIARNQDDHTKNIAFLMSKTGEWSLSPAFDVIYSYNPDGAWTGQHQMTLNGKRDGFERADFEAAGKTVALKRGRALAILDEVAQAVQHWKEFAKEGGVPSELADRIAQAHRRPV